jgi:long-chain fatty acid transport protein
MKLKITALLALSLMTPLDARGAGFAVFEQTAKSGARIAAMTATVDDASAVFYNPAALADVKGGDLQLSIAFIRPSARYEGPGLPSTRPPGVDTVKQDSEGQFIPDPSIFYSRQLTKRSYLGFGIYAPYGLKLDWGAQRGFVGRTVLETVDLRTIFFTPSIGLALTDEISFGFQVSLVPATIYLRQVLGASDGGQVLFPAADNQDGYAEMSASAFGVGAGAGVRVKLLDHLRLGAMYRTGVDLEFDGDVDFTLPNGIPTGIAASFRDGEVKTKVPLPPSLAFGVGWVDGPLTLEVDLNVTFWSVIKELRIDFSTGLPAPTTVSPRDWTTTPTVRFGGEYRFGDYAARIGLGYDLNAVPDHTLDPTLPDANRILMSIGGGAKLGSLNLDLAYAAVLVAERESKGSKNFADGLYAGSIIHILGLTAGYAM